MGCRFAASWQAANPEKAALLQSGLAREVPADLMDQVQVFAEDAKVATRAAGSQIINDLAKACPLLVSGSADLHGSTKNYLKELGDFSRENRSGRNLLFGIREHAMGAIVNGIGYYGIFRPSGATFAVFADYMRGSVRLSALVGLPIFHVWTHDSVGVGEDGPTHQPVETTRGLRVIPNLDVIRPADPEESAGAFVAALQRTDGPTGLILTIQSVPNLNSIPVSERRNGVLKGGSSPARKKASSNSSFWLQAANCLLLWKRPTGLVKGFALFPCPAWSVLTVRMPNTGNPCFPKGFEAEWPWRPVSATFGVNTSVLTELWSASTVSASPHPAIR